MFCFNCGKEIPEKENIKFCPFCGKNIDIEVPNMDENIHCPKCGSSNFQIDKRGYDTKAIEFGCIAIILGFLTFGLSWVVLLFILLSGHFGSNKPIWVCKRCGHKWNQNNLSSNIDKESKSVLNFLGFENKNDL